MFTAPPAGVGYLHEKQRGQAAENARLKTKLAAVNAVDDEARARDVDVLSAALRTALDALRMLRDGGADVAAVIAECDHALAEVDPLRASAVAGEGGEGR
jgi:hypothetical protein